MVKFSVLFKTNFQKLKENATWKYTVLQSRKLYKPQILIKTGEEIRKLWTIEYFNIGGMGANILNL